MEIILDKQLLTRCDLAGNKAAILASLIRQGFNIPRFFVVTASCLDADSGIASVRKAVSRELHKMFGKDARVAVRSSSVEEDGVNHSFAGQFDSFLNIEHEQVFDYALRVARSGASDHVRSYRQSVGEEQGVTGPAVLIQEMVDADTAGVAFAIDPVTGDDSVAVVAATSGTGDALVSGETQGDTWRVDVEGVVIARELEDADPVLSDSDVARIAELSRSVSAHRGRPQDIEWAIAEGELFLLQSRDITTMDRKAETGPCALWDNSNIVESYGGVTSPLTFTVAREAYQEAYRHLGRVLGVSEKNIKDNERAYEQMIGLIQGRVYYNLLNWYRLLMLTPGFRFNKGFMEQMMGVTEGLPEDAMPRAESAGRYQGIRALIDSIRVTCRLATKLISHNRKVRQFHQKLESLLVPVDLSSMTMDELIDYYEDLQSEVIPAWETPLVNDLFCMIFHGALRKLCAAWLDEDIAGIHNDLVAGEAAIVSLEPVRRMQYMAAIANDNPQFVSVLRNAPIDIVQQEIARQPRFATEYENYLDQFGDRCLDELKLESETLRDDPSPLIRSIGQLAGMPERHTEGDGPRQSAEDKIASHFRSNVIRRLVFNRVLGLARSRVRDRENLRFERTRVYGRVRAVFVEIGRQLKEADLIEHRDDIFFLDVAEVIAFIRGTGVSSGLATLIEGRRREFEQYRADDDPPRRFITRGPAQLQSSISLIPTDAPESGDIRNGQACSQGVVRGQVRIVTDPRKTEFREGEILVAQRTDPGWVTIFPLVKGMIMERGSLLSHSAIVARELNIPAVVGVENACQWLEDGDWVELDGATGVIRRLGVTEQAA